MSKLVSASGQRIGASGLYQVIHYPHSLPKRIVLVKGQTFPPCAECEGPVTFIQVRLMPHLDKLHGCIVLRTLPVLKEAA